MLPGMERRKRLVPIVNTTRRKVSDKKDLSESSSSILLDESSKSSTKPLSPSKIISPRQNNTTALQNNSRVQEIALLLQQVSRMAKDEHKIDQNVLRQEEKIFSPKLPPKTQNVNIFSPKRASSIHEVYVVSPKSVIQKINIPSQKLTPQTHRVNIPPSKLAPQTQKVSNTTLTQKINIPTQKLTPQTHRVNIPPSKLAPQTQKVSNTTPTQNINIPTQKLAPQTQGVNIYPSKLVPQIQKANNTTPTQKIKIPSTTPTPPIQKTRKSYEKTNSFQGKTVSQEYTVNRPLKCYTPARKTFSPAQNQQLVLNQYLSKDQSSSEVSRYQLNTESDIEIQVKPVEQNIKCQKLGQNTFSPVCKKHILVNQQNLQVEASTAGNLINSSERTIDSVSHKKMIPNDTVPSLKCYAPSIKTFSPTSPQRSNCKNEQPLLVKHHEQSLSVESNILINTKSTSDDKNASLLCSENSINKVTIVNSDKNENDTNKKYDSNNINNSKTSQIKSNYQDIPQNAKLNIKKISDKDTKIFILSPADLVKMGINLNTLQERTSNGKESRSKTRKQKEPKTKQTKTKEQCVTKQVESADVKKTLHAKISKKQNDLKINKVDHNSSSTLNSSICVGLRENELNDEISKNTSSSENSLNMETAACITNYLIFSPKEGIANYIEGYNRAIQNTDKKQEDSSQIQCITDASRRHPSSENVICKPILKRQSQTNAEFSKGHEEILTDSFANGFDIMSVINSQSNVCGTINETQMINSETLSVASSAISKINQDLSDLQEPANIYTSSLEHSLSSDNAYSQINLNSSNSHQINNNDNSNTSTVKDCSQFNEELPNLHETINVNESSITIFDCIQRNEKSLKIQEIHMESNAHEPTNNIDSFSVENDAPSDCSQKNEEALNTSDDTISSLVELIIPGITEETLKLCEESVYVEPSGECNRSQSSVISIDRHLNEDNNMVNDISFELVDLNSDDDVGSFDINEDLGEQCLENFSSGVTAAIQDKSLTLNCEYTGEQSGENFNPNRQDSSESLLKFSNLNHNFNPVNNTASQDEPENSSISSNLNQVYISEQYLEIHNPEISMATRVNSENLSISSNLIPGFVGEQPLENSDRDFRIATQDECHDSIESLDLSDKHLVAQTVDSNEKNPSEKDNKDFLNNYRNIEMLFKSLSKSIIVSESGELLPVTESELHKVATGTENQIESNFQSSSTDKQNNVECENKNESQEVTNEDHLADENSTYKNRRRKISEDDDSSVPSLVKSHDANETFRPQTSTPKKRGRKISSESSDDNKKPLEISPPPPKKRGRKSKKNSSANEKKNVTETPSLPFKKRKRKDVFLDSSDEETPLSSITSKKKLSLIVNTVNDFVDTTKSKSKAKSTQMSSNDTKVQEEITETTSPDTQLGKGEVKCGVCSQVMKSVSFQKHSLNSHYYLAWIDGQKKPDLSSQSISVALLNKAIKVLKKLPCSRCPVKKASAVGYLTHINTCQKTPEEIEAYKLLCTICDSRVFPSSFPYHMSKHEQENVQQKEPDVSVTSETKSKRKAASAAEDLFKKMETDTVLENYHDLYTKGYLPTLSKRMETIWKNKIKSHKKISCSRKTCLFECDNIEAIRSHYLETCEFACRKPFKCKVCKHQCDNEESITEHVKSHNFNEEKKHDEYVADDRDFSASESSDSEVPSDTCVKGNRSKAILAAAIAKQSGLSSFTKTSLEVPLRFSFDKPRDKETKLRKINVSWMKYLMSKLYSCKGLFPEYRCNFFVAINENEVDSYLPQSRESCNISHINETSEAVYEVVWSKYKLFQCEVKNGIQTFWCGGSVHAVDYLPSSYEKAYVAVAAKNLNDRYSEAESYSHKGLVQIWDLGPLNNKNHQCLSPAAMVMGLAHEHGVVWDSSWCPSGCNDYNPNESSESNRMGLLAIACSDGNAYVYAVCHPDTLPQSNIKVWKTDPVIALCISLKKNSEESSLGRVQYQATKLCWSQDGVFNIIVVGYSNGIVAYYNMSTKSPLLTIKRGNTRYISPYKLFQAQPSGITGLILMPNFENSQDAPLVVSSFVGTNVWRGDHLTYSRVGNYSGLAFPLIFPEVMSFSELVGTSYSRSHPIPLALSNGIDTRWSIYDEGCHLGCVMNWSSTLYSVTYHGQVSRRPYRSPFVSRHRCNKSGMRMKILCWYTNVVKLNAECVDLAKIRTVKKSEDLKRRKSVDPNIPSSLMSYDETTEKYGLLMVDVNANCSFRGNTTVNFENMRMWPLWEQLCMKSCTVNENHYNFAISGSRAGFCRNVYVPQVKQN